MRASLPAAMAVSGKTSFAILARRIFSLNPTIQLVVLNEVGSDECWAWRNPVTGEVCSHAAANTADAVDPLAFILSEDANGVAAQQSIDPYRLLFVVLAYDDILQILVRLGGTANLSVAVPPGTDAYALGRQIVRLIDSCAPGPVVH